MPELLPLWERWVSEAGADDEAARFLSFWNPPRYLAHCSQAVSVDRDGPLLLRNYDLDPALSEATLLKSAWLGRDVIGMVEGMAGLSDGMNAAGLAVSLAFGGKPVHGRGFGIPIILRYLLEVCSDVEQAVEALRAIPCHMAYNVILLDKSGRHAAVMLAHDRPAIVTDLRYQTNHQPGLIWPWYNRQTRSEERAALLQRLLERDGIDGAALEAAFLSDPLHVKGYGKGFGTVFTAVYRPLEGKVSLTWPGLTPWSKSFSNFVTDARSLQFSDGVAPKAAESGPAQRFHQHPGRYSYLNEQSGTCFT